MKRIMLTSLVSTVALAVSVGASAESKPSTMPADRLMHSRAVEAVIWGMPTVGEPKGGRQFISSNSDIASVSESEGLQFFRSELYSNAPANAGTKVRKVSHHWHITTTGSGGWEQKTPAWN